MVDEVLKVFPPQHEIHALVMSKWEKRKALADKFALWTYQLRIGKKGEFPTNAFKAAWALDDFKYLMRGLALCEDLAVPALKDLKSPEVLAELYGFALAPKSGRYKDSHRLRDVNKLLSYFGAICRIESKNDELEMASYLSTFDQ